MSYSIEIIFQGDNHTPPTQRSVQYGDLQLHQGGQITIDNRLYARHVPINIRSRSHTIEREEHSDIILVERNGKQVLALHYWGIAGCYGEWQRLIPHGEAPLRFATPNRRKRLCRSIIEFVITKGCLLCVYLQAALDGATHTDRTRR